MSNDLPGEKWLPITTHEGKYFGRYQVSNMGRVRADPNARIGGCKPGRILFQGKDNKGYRQVYLYRDQKQMTVKVHRLVASMFMGQRNGLTVNHIDGDKDNNKLCNLEYIENKANNRHAFRVIVSRPSIEVHGVRMCWTEAVERYGAQGVTAQSARRRHLRLGWPPLKALTTAIMPTGRPRRG